MKYSFQRTACTEKRRVHLILSAQWEEIGFELVAAEQLVDPIGVTLRNVSGVINAFKTF